PSPHRGAILVAKTDDGPTAQWIVGVPGRPDPSIHEPGSGGGAGADRPRGAGGAGPPPAARAIHGGHVGHLSLTWCSSRVTCCSSRGHARLGCPRGPAAVRRVTVVVRSSRRATLPEVHPLRPPP